MGKLTWFTITIPYSYVYIMNSNVLSCDEYIVNYKAIYAFTLKKRRCYRSVNSMNFCFKSFESLLTGMFAVFSMLLCRVYIRNTNLLAGSYNYNC